MLTQRSKDMERIITALELCRKLHAGQTDKCGQPYWIHPFTVAMIGFIKFDNYKSVSCAIVGLLHDIPEDTGMSVDALTQLIELTDEEIEALNLLTHQDGVSYDQYIDAIINSGNEIAMNVKFSDLSHNMNLNRFLEANLIPTDKDDKRNKKYRKAYRKILSFLP